MSSPTLLKIAGSIFLLMPLGHTQMYLDVLVPALKTIPSTTSSHSVGSYASAVSWNQANGYFITAGLLCFKWASTGIAEGWERYIFYTLMVTHVGAALMYLKKGVSGPAAIYAINSLLMGIAALKGN